MAAPSLPPRANKPPPPPVPRSTKPNLPKRLPAIKKKRCLLWDWTCTDEKNGVPWAMDNIDFQYVSSVCNWNAWTPPELKDRAPFRPMVRTEGQLEGWEWTAISDTKEPIIHFFNEPERIPIAAEKAADIWTERMVPLQAKGKKVSSPGCASDPGGEAWLDKFMSLTSSHPPDFLNLHYYGPDGDGAIAYLEKLHAKYPGLPVIVSEIACISRDIGQVHAFTKQLVNWMDETDWIFEYAFFGCMPKPADDFVSPQAQLMNEDGSFTALMKKLMTEQPMT
ncbi:hypothetical protein BP6252_12111 [Coleophoma cylindrospora]|uniref:Asl1-like glycosyl hydrolase catalytic domain-containing protein n=1 Tax=Coleophoma cylindrospora TaxID=1849047 RepID=A0A3D8QGB4_9HELO|nr:hypothetical protein BP6252_12111 [Coleophoma cylindrospora]